ncbi:MAG: hypothetical protein IPJ41_18555 [Phycisphaerales bacterium]|nr:hypothetical protein [Phycisphaerales bacterium]
MNAAILDRLDLELTTGSIADYDGLASHHYRAGRPATIARGPGGRPAIRTLRDARGRAVGVLVVSMPTLNGAWRAIAWPGHYATGDGRRDAARLNREVRCLSRLVIDPRWRGLGLATLLVRDYLRAPRTRRTEAVAAMGRACACFERAGMTAYRLPPTLRDARLLDAHACAHIEPWEWLDPARAEPAIARAPWLLAEARAWANASGATRSWLGLEPTHLIRAAATAAANRPLAYTHGD